MELMRARRTGSVLLDACRDAALRRRGYVVLDLLGPAAADALRTQWGELHGWELQTWLDIQPPDFEIATWSSDDRYRRAVTDMVLSATTGPLARHVDGHRPVGGTFMVKWPVPEDHVPFDGVPDRFHNDSTFVDERQGARSYMVWVALQRIDGRNGGLRVVPSSHRLPRTVRGWGLEPPWLEYQEVLEQHSVPVDLDAGQAVLFDPSLVHRSGPNRSSDVRAAVSVLLAEPGEPLCLFRSAEGGGAEKVDLPDDFFTTGDYRTVAELPAVEQLDAEVPPSSAAALDRRLSWLARRDVLRSAAARVRGR